MFTISRICGEILRIFHENLSNIQSKLLENIIVFKALPKNAKKFDEILLKYWGLSGAKGCKSCRSHQELSNEYFVAKFGENEPYKVWSFGWELRIRFDIEPFNYGANHALDGPTGLEEDLEEPTLVARVSAMAGKRADTWDSFTSSRAVNSF